MLYGTQIKLYRVVFKTKLLQLVFNCDCRSLHLNYLQKGAGVGVKEGGGAGQNY